MRWGTESMTKISALSKRRTSTMGVKRTVGSHTRKKLIMSDVARSQAARKQTLLIKRDVDIEASGVSERGEALKEGILGMADVSLLPDDVYAKLNAMDANKLDALYQNNDIIFEVYFDYGGIDKGENGANIVDKGKKLSDAKFLIDQYERTFGKIAI